MNCRRCGHSFHAKMGQKRYCADCEQFRNRERLAARRESIRMRSRPLSPVTLRSEVPSEVIEALSLPPESKRLALAALLGCLLLIAVPVRAADLDGFLRAVHRVETGGRVGAIRGDSGRSLGPLQIQRAYWQDSGVTGRYGDCVRLEYSRRVAVAYFRRYEPQALRRGDWETLARLHNAGPGWRKYRRATDGYWAKVKREMR